MVDKLFTVRTSLFQSVATQVIAKLMRKG